MKPITLKLLLPIFLFFCLQAQGQVKELNLYVGYQFLNIPQINEWENVWDLDPVNNAMSAEFSANYYPIKNKKFFIQTGVKYHKVRGQFGPIEFIKSITSTTDLSNPELANYRYGFDLQYFVIQVSPSVKLELSKSLNLTFGIGLMGHHVIANQKGFEIYVDPEDFTSTVFQYSGRHTNSGLSYNLATSISKDLSNKVSLSLKAEYNVINVVIGEKSGSFFSSNSAVLPNQRNITVPIHQRNLDLSGLNILAGVSFKISNKN